MAAVGTSRRSRRLAGGRDVAAVGAYRDHSGGNSAARLTRERGAEKASQKITSPLPRAPSPLRFFAFQHYYYYCQNINNVVSCEDNS